MIVFPSQVSLKLKVVNLRVKEPYKLTVMVFVMRLHLLTSADNVARLTGQLSI